MYEPRKYRDLFKGQNLYYSSCMVKETDVQVGASRLLTNEVRSSVARYRQQIEEYAWANREFLVSLSPVEPAPAAPEIVKRMCQAGRSVGVGPMAAVAGAVSEFVGRDLLDNCYTREVIVENGGDIFMKTLMPRKVGIYAGASPLSQKVFLEIRPEDTPVGVCTSSGTFGHALSFGKADAAVVLAHDGALADAAATAMGNKAFAEDQLEAAISFISQVDGVLGALLIMGEKMVVWGEVRLA